MKTPTDPRHQERIRLMQHLFSSQFQKTPDSLTQKIWDHLDQIDPVIVPAAPQRPLDKLNAVDLAILRLAIYELIIDKTAPYKVIIDESIELAKQFGSSGSPAFVNGALGQIVKTYHLDA